MAAPILAIAEATPDCQPELFGPGLFSTDKEEWRLELTPDGRTAFWAVSDDFFPFSRYATIVTSTYRNGAWSAPEVASFSGVHADLDPHLSPDGRSLYFSSIRPVDGVEREDVDVWVVNSPADERQPLGVGVNTVDFWEFNPEITPDGQTLLFTGLFRPDGYGLGDIYVSQAAGDDFGPARNLGPCVNTELDEYHPTLLADRHTLFFVRHSYEPWVPGDFYRVRLP